MRANPDYLNPQLSDYIELLITETEAISSKRRDHLKKMAAELSGILKDEDHLKLIYICTHNSRRSHLAQLWAQAAAYHFNISYVECYSGGTEATAFHPNTVAALRRCGIEISTREEEKNPHYHVSFAIDGPVQIMFSKEFGDPFNPAADFVAVMTCSDADEACPVVSGAKKRYSLPYEDPKKADGTSDEEATYDARCREIGREMFYLFREVSDQIKS